MHLLSDSILIPCAGWPKLKQHSAWKSRWAGLLGSSCSKICLITNEEIKSVFISSWKEAEKIWLWILTASSKASKAFSIFDNWKGMEAYFKSVDPGLSWSRVCSVTSLSSNLEIEHCIGLISSSIESVFPSTLSNSCIAELNSKKWSDFSSALVKILDLAIASSK